MPQRCKYTDTLLKVDHISLSYDDKVILRDVNAEIRNIVRDDCTQGQVVGFLGPSGIGKTQLFRIIAGLNQPTSGQVLVNSTLTPVKAGMVGVVAQNYPLFENRTIFSRQFQIAYTKEGESFGAAAKKNECVVTGGLGTIEVTHNGKTYYVCCTGCRDYFNENPEKVLAEHAARKK